MKTQILKPDKKSIILIVERTAQSSGFFMPKKQAKLRIYPLLQVNISFCLA